MGDQIAFKSLDSGVSVKKQTGVNKFIEALGFSVPINLTVTPNCCMSLSNCFQCIRVLLLRYTLKLVIIQADLADSVSVDSAGCAGSERSIDRKTGAATGFNAPAADIYGSNQ